MERGPQTAYLSSHDSKSSGSTSPNVLRAAAGSLLGPLARQLTASQPRILFYHRIGERRRALSPRLFAEQLAYLRRHFVPMRLAEVVARQAAGEPMPSRAVVVTVDDGYRDFADHAYPELVRYGIPVTLYAVSRFASGAIWLWFDRLRYICERSECRVLSVTGPEGPITCALDTPEAREKAWDTIATCCLSLPTLAREALIEACATGGEVDVPARAPDDYAPLDYAGLRRLDPALVEIGAHTLTHPILSMCTDAEVVDEIAHSRSELEREIGRTVDSFCYPNGRPCDFDGRSVAAVRAAGFRCGLASTGMFLTPASDPYLLPRFGAAHDLRTFRHEMNGLTYLQSRVPGSGAEYGAGEIAGRASSYAVL